MAEDSGQSVLASLESHVLPLVPDIRERLSRGIDVLDLGCGSGRIINRLAQLFPRSRFEGQDLSVEAVSAATKDATAKNLRNASFVAQDTVSCMHCMTVSLAQGGEGLGAMRGEERTREYLKAAGFTSIEVHQLSHDIQNNWYVVRST
jgi:SAM-dependent methyltransferase